MHVFLTQSKTRPTDRGVRLPRGFRDRTLPLLLKLYLFRGASVTGPHVFRGPSVTVPPSFEHHVFGFREASVTGPPPFHWSCHAFREASVTGVPSFEFHVYTPPWLFCMSSLYKIYTPPSCFAGHVVGPCQKQRFCDLFRWGASEICRRHYHTPAELFREFLLG